MPHLNRYQEFNFRRGQPGRVDSLYSNVMPKGAIQARLSHRTRGKGSELSPLEEQIIALSVAGYTPEERANILGISEPTLRLHLADIFDKLDVVNELELILFALYYYLIDSREVTLSRDGETLGPS